MPEHEAFDTGESGQIYGDDGKKLDGSDETPEQKPPEEETPVAAEEVAKEPEKKEPEPAKAVKKAPVVEDEAPDAEELQAKIDALQKKADQYDHLSEVAAKNPTGFREVVGKHFPGTETKEPVKFDAAMLDGTKTTEELATYIDKLVDDKTDERLSQRGLNDVLQDREEARLEKEYPAYKEVKIKESAANFQRLMEVDPSGTLTEMMIKAAAYDNLGDVVEAGTKIAETVRKQKLAAKGQEGSKQPQEAVSPANTPEATPQSKAREAVRGEDGW